MFLFYTPVNADGSITLIGDELRHAVKTLRKRVGEEIWSTDGLGTKYKSRIKDISKKEATLEVLEQHEIELANPNLHIAIALTKKSARIEWFLEKATEIGIGQITPLITARTEKRNFNKERGSKIVIAAMKQSLRSHLPVLSESVLFKDFIKSEVNSSNDKFVGFYKEDNSQLMDVLRSGNDSTILIGPEGDFTGEEIGMVSQAGFTSINLGVHRLRTETAGIVACHSFNIVNNG